MGFGEKLVQRLGEYGKLGKSFREAVGESFCRAERLSFSVSEWIAFGLSQPIGIAQLVRLTQPIGKPFDIGQRFAQSLGKPFRVAESFSVSERIAVSLAQRVAFGIGQCIPVGQRLGLDVGKSFPVGQRFWQCSAEHLRQRLDPLRKPTAVGERPAKSIGDAAAQWFRLRLAPATKQCPEFCIEQPVQRIVECQPQPIGQQPKSSLVIIDRLGFIQCRVGIIRRIAIEFRPAVLHTG